MTNSGSPRTWFESTEDGICIKTSRRPFKPFEKHIHWDDVDEIYACGREGWAEYHYNLMFVMKDKAFVYVDETIDNWDMFIDKIAHSFSGFNKANYQELIDECPLREIYLPCWIKDKKTPTLRIDVQPLNIRIFNVDDNSVYHSFPTSDFTAEKKDKKLLPVRLLLTIFVIILILSGVTAFPLVSEIRILERVVGQGTFMDDIFPPMAEWISHIHRGVEEASTEQPFMFYGTDWLAFGHIAIGIFMIGAIVNPVRNIWVIEAAMIACILVIPTALICGPIRGIPFFWQLIDCSFGIFGVIPLWITRSWIKRIETS